MTSHDPSFARRLLPALALTGAGLGLVNVLDNPTSTSAAGAAGQAGVGADGTSTGGAAIAAGNTVPGLTTVPPVTPSTAASSSGGASTAGSGSGSSSNSGSGSGSSSGSGSTQTPATQTPSTAATAPSACGAISSNGSQEQISIRGRTYGTVVVTAKFTSGGKLCSVSASYNVSDRKSVQIEEYAIPRLTKQAVAANSANINGISGATAISNAYSRSLQSAIDAK